MEGKIRIQGSVSPFEDPGPTTLAHNLGLVYGSWLKPRACLYLPKWCCSPTVRPKARVVPQGAEEFPPPGPMTGRWTAGRLCYQMLA